MGLEAGKHGGSPTARNDGLWCPFRDESTVASFPSGVGRTSQLKCYGSSPSSESTDFLTSQNHYASIFSVSSAQFPLKWFLRRILCPPDKWKFAEKIWDAAFCFVESSFSLNNNTHNRSYLRVYIFLDKDYLSCYFDVFYITMPLSQYWTWKDPNNWCTEEISWHIGLHWRAFYCFAVQLKW